jgi:NAD(P)-dependent dehydrogenase (short-subunit alcohol dehydrogenase family)
MTLGWYERLHMRHRRWRYEYKSEKPSLAFLQSLDLDGRTLIDVGANRGIYTWIMSQCAGPEDNVVVTGEGLSSEPGVLELQRSRVGAGQAGVNLPAGTFDEMLEVPVTTLDLFLAKTTAKPIGLIKADVEGHEFAVFKGAERTIAEHRPILLFELMDTEADRGDMFSLMMDLGYTGWFYCVNPEDHRSLRRRGHGVYYSFDAHNQHVHAREGSILRNYFFAPIDSAVARKIQGLEGQKLRTAAL